MNSYQYSLNDFIVRENDVIASNKSIGKTNGLKMELELVHEWLRALSVNYNVNPYIFAGIYVGAIPFFTISVARIVRNKRQNKPITLPVIPTGFFLSSAYINLPDFDFL